MKFAGTKITQESILKAREWFADNCDACIEEATSGAVFVNDLPSYILWREKQKAEVLAGKHDHTFTFMQKAHYIQTGESVALLP